MNDTKREWGKTIALVAIAICAFFMARAFQPKPPVTAEKELIGQKLFPAFKDPTELGTIRISRISGSLLLSARPQGWVISSWMDYPADNREQMARVVSPFLELTVLDQAEETLRNADSRKIREFHRLCGLLDPGNLRPGEESDAAIHLQLADRKGGELVDLLIGRTVPGSSDQRDVRYVRFPNRDLVCTVDFAVGSKEEVAAEVPLSIPERLSLDPLDWLNRDLLRISRWNIKTLSLHDYRYNREKNGISPHGFYVFEQDQSHAMSDVWRLKKQLKIDAKNQYGAVAIPNDGKISNTRINEAADVLSHLQIQGVLKKSPLLTEILLQGRSLREMILKEEKLDDLGFYLADFDLLHPEKTEPCLIGENGEIRLLLKDGISIHLIFGREQEKKFTLFVQTLFDPDFVKKPELLVEKKIDPKMSDKEKKSIQTENERIRSENQLRQNEYDLTLSEGTSRAARLNERFAPWFYLISQESYQKIRFNHREL